jgi:RNAse (barnase) inhibitor barstar
MQRSKPIKPKKKSCIRLKSQLRSIVQRFPIVESSVINIWHPTKYHYWKLRWNLEALLGDQRAVSARKIDVNKIYIVDPQKIIYSALYEFRLRDYKGHVLDGNWDTLEKRFDQLDLYLAIKQVCVEGAKWVDTEFYQSTLKEIREGHIHYGCFDEKDLLKHCHKIDTLYYNIKHNGYQSQTELFKKGQILDPLVAEEEVAIAIGRFGDLLFCDGAHRLAIAKLLNLPAIPVKVAVRHKEWMMVRDELSTYARNNQILRESSLYQQFNHLDLSDFPSSHDSKNRLERIKKRTNRHRG